MTQLLVTESGEQHGLINSVANSVEDNGFKHMKPEVKTKAEKLKKEEHRIVKARYINHRGDHERLTKPYCRWAGDPIDTYHLIPGHTYDLPMGLVNEINSSPGLAKRSDLLDSKGLPTIKDGKNEKLHELVPVGF
jgi:hypothetical protein